MKNNLTIIIPLYERVENTEIFLKNNIYSEYNYFFVTADIVMSIQKKFSSFIVKIFITKNLQQIQFFHMIL